MFNIFLMNSTPPTESIFIFSPKVCLKSTIFNTFSPYSAIWAIETKDSESTYKNLASVIILFKNTSLLNVTFNIDILILELISLHLLVHLDEAFH